MSNILYDVWLLTRWNILRTVLILIALLITPSINLPKLLFIIIFWNTIIDILVYEPDLKRWIKSTSFTAAFVFIIWAAYQLAGFYGVVGLTLIGFLVMGFFVAATLYSNWKLYNAVTTWGAMRIKGRTKEPFKLNEVIKHENKKRRKTKRSLHK